MSSTTTFDWPGERRWNRRRDVGTRVRRDVAEMNMRSLRLVAWAILCGTVTGVSCVWVVIR